MFPKESFPLVWLSETSTFSAGAEEVAAQTAQPFEDFSRTALLRDGGEAAPLCRNGQLEIRAGQA